MSTYDRERSRRSQSFLRTVPVGITSVLLLPQNARRVSITFYSLNGQRYTATPNADSVIDQGVNVPAGTAGHTLCEEDHADAIRSSWTVVASAAAQTVAVLETIVNNVPDMPRATPGAV